MFSKCNIVNYYILFEVMVEASRIEVERSDIDPPFINYHYLRMYRTKVIFIDFNAGWD